MSERASAGPVICLMGPTAAGKTAIAMALAARAPVDIISVDSAMVYRGLDIGTGKPTAAQCARAPHALIDICEPHVAYSAARFAQDAYREVLASWARRRIPLLVGGTGLYFRALLDGLSVLPAASAELRARLDAFAALNGARDLHRWLDKVDPQTAARLHPNDAQRVQRALEVALITGKPMSAQFDAPVAPLNVSARKFVIAPPVRRTLHERIERRFDGMLAAGLIDEVRGLVARPHIHRNLPSMRSVGYRQCWAFLDGQFDRAELAERGKAATRQLARRQLTWLRKEPFTHWLDPDAAGVVDQLSEAVARLADGGS